MYERWGGIGKGPQAGTLTRVARSATVPYVVGLTTRPSAPKEFQLLPSRRRLAFLYYRIKWCKNIFVPAAITRLRSLLYVFILFLCCCMMFLVRTVFSDFYIFYSLCSMFVSLNVNLHCKTNLPMGTNKVDMTSLLLIDTILSLCLL